MRVDVIWQTDKCVGKLTVRTFQHFFRLKNDFNARKLWAILHECFFYGRALYWSRIPKFLIHRGTHTPRTKLFMGYPHLNIVRPRRSSSSASIQTRGSPRLIMKNTISSSRLKKTACAADGLEVMSTVLPNPDLCLVGDGVARVKSHPILENAM